MISPARVEGYLTLQPEIAQAMVFGRRRPYLVAVIVPNPELVESVARRRALRRVDAAGGASRNRQGGGRGGGAGQCRPCRRSSACAASSSPSEPFTTANGQMTPTLKIKRHAIRRAYGEALVALYEKPGN